jgi:endoglucanase
MLPGIFPAAAFSPAPTWGTIPADLTAHELVARMGTGWNLGNTFDVHANPGSRLEGEILDIETLWLGGRANQTTQTLIQTIRRAGFDTLRIPVTWSKVADPDNGWQIRADWMERVKQVIDWAMEEDMFVILNAHHENSALDLQTGDASLSSHASNVFVSNIWRQIAETFRDYDERLIFEGLNEPRHEGGQNEWWGATQEVRDNLNFLNQAFVDAVRATGGNNMHRILLVPPVAAGATPNGMRDFLVPEDPLNSVNKIIWSIHTYSPFNWAHEGRGGYEGPSEIIQNLETIKQNAERLGIPVILGEWGSIGASVGTDPDQDLRDTQRPQHAEDYVREARNRGMVAIVWDNGGFAGTGHTFGLIRRNHPHEISDLHQAVIDGIMLGAGIDVSQPATGGDTDSEDNPGAGNGADNREAPVDEGGAGNEEGSSAGDGDDTDDGGGLGAWLWVLLIGGGAALVIIFIAVKNKKTLKL